METTTIIVITTTILLTHTLLPTLLVRLGHFFALSRIPGGHNQVLLTFDDGPDPLYTPQILTILARYQAKALFFVTGKNALAHPELIKQMVAEGHSVGNHCLHHKAVWLLGPVATIREITATDRILQDITGKKPEFHRPNWGLYTLISLWYYRRHGLKNILWSFMSWDWGKGATPERITDLVLKRVRKGSILVLHDSESFGASHGSPNKVIQALPRIIEGIRATGLQIGSPDVLNEGGATENTQELRSKTASAIGSPVSNTRETMATSLQLGSPDVLNEGEATDSALQSRSKASSAVGSPVSGTRRKPMRRALLSLWLIIDPIIRRFAGIADTGAPASLLRIARRRYRGQDWILNEGTVLRKGDLLLELHINNEYLMDLLGSTPSIGAITATTMAELHRSLPTLASILETDPRYREVKILLGITLLHRAGRRFGFTAYDLKPGLTSTLVNLYERFLFYLYYPRETTAATRKKLTAKYLVITRQELIARHGADRGTVPF